jgi:hypothetical protein
MPRIGNGTTTGGHQSFVIDKLPWIIVLLPPNRNELGWLHPYQPSLSSSWLFQRSMSVGVGQLARSYQQQQQQQQQQQSGAQQNGAASSSSSSSSSSQRTSWVQLPPDHVNQVRMCEIVIEILGICMAQSQLPPDHVNQVRILPGQVRYHLEYLLRSVVLFVPKVQCHEW